MPRRDGLTNHTYYNLSPECWSVYTEVLEAEYSNGLLFGQVHQLTVDAYAVQHAGNHIAERTPYRAHRTVGRVDARSLGGFRAMMAVTVAGIDE